MNSAIRIPFEVIISDEIRFYGPSGNYITVLNDLKNPYFRLIDTEIDRTLNAAKATIDKERSRPIATEEKI